MLILLAAFGLLSLSAETAPQDVKKVVAVVAGDDITEGHVQLVGLLAGHTEVTPQLRRELISRLVENRLVAAHLRRARLGVNRSELTQATRDARVRLKAAGVDLRARLKELALNDADLRRELEAGKLWSQFKVRTITGEKIRERFEQRRTQFDGTRVRASQIFLKVPADDPAPWAKAQTTLNALRARIVAGEITFAQAARENSQSPSAKSGGDVGLFPYAGVMPADFSARAFALDKGKVGQPFRSRFGAHLIMVTERHPGDLSPEDARPVIYRQLEREAWNAIVKAERTRTAVSFPGKEQKKPEAAKR